MILIFTYLFDVCFIPEYIFILLCFFTVNLLYMCTLFSLINSAVLVEDFGYPLSSYNFPEQINCITGQ